MTGIPDELIDTAARALYDHDREGRGGALGPYPAWDRALDDDHAGYRIQADVALGAVGLPALLERVEAADGKVVQYLQLMEGATTELQFLRIERDDLAAKLADAGERIALAIEKANRKVIDARVADINAKPHIVDRVLTYAAQVARAALRGDPE